MTVPLKVLKRAGYDTSALEASYTPPVQRPPKERAAYKIAAAALRHGGVKHGHTVHAPWRPFCDSPVPVQLSAPGFAGNARYSAQHPVRVDFYAPCRRCPKCLRVKRSLWAARAKEETAKAPRTWSVTLTFSPVHLAGVLTEAALVRGRDKGARVERAAYMHVQRYLKRVRSALRCKLRYLCVAEYGSETGRLHFHLLLHEVDKPIPKRTIERLWRSNVHARLVKSVRQVEYLCKYLTKDSSSRMRPSKHYGPAATAYHRRGRSGARTPHATKTSENSCFHKVDLGWNLSLQKSKSDENPDRIPYLETVRRHFPAAEPTTSDAVRKVVDRQAVSVSRPEGAGRRIPQALAEEVVNSKVYAAACRRLVHAKKRDTRSTALRLSQATRGE